MRWGMFYVPRASLSNEDLGKSIRGVMSLKHKYQWEITWMVAVKMTWSKITNQPAETISALWDYCDINCSASASLCRSSHMLDFFINSLSLMLPLLAYTCNLLNKKKSVRWLGEYMFILYYNCLKIKSSNIFDFIDSSGNHACIYQWNFKSALIFISIGFAMMHIFHCKHLRQIHLIC